MKLDCSDGIKGVSETSNAVGEQFFDSWSSHGVQCDEPPECQKLISELGWEA